jgi:phosphinothricin acetyltransferase
LHRLFLIATMSQLLIRPCAAADLPAVAAIYAVNVHTGTGTFEIDAPSEADMCARHADVTGKGLPWLVGELDGRVVGYAYANHFRLRPAYRYTLEDSIYLDPAVHGRGLGRLLLAELMARCTALGVRQLLAVIGDSANQGSIGVHRACGFSPLGVMTSVGWKFDRWLDVVLMQRALGPGDTAVPHGTPGLTT